MASSEHLESFHRILDRQDEPVQVSLDSRSSGHEGAEGDDSVSRHFLPKKVINIEDDPLLPILEDLWAKANLPSLTNATSEKHQGLMIFWHPFTKFLPIVPKLESLLSSNELEHSLKQEIDLLLRKLWSPWYEYENHQEETSEEMLASRKAILESNQVSFSDLESLFLPGFWGYSNTRMLSKTKPFEECWIIRSREICVSDRWRRRILRITCLQWLLHPSLVNLILVPTSFYIEEYSGKKAIAVDEIGIVPLEALADHDRKTVRGRMVERGKNYVKVFNAPPPMALWDYQGPAWRPRVREGGKDGFDVDDWNSSADQINCKVIVHRYYTRPLGEPSDSSEHMPINDAIPADAFMTCFGHVRVRTLPELDEFLIPCDGLSPIAWVDVTLNGRGAWVADMIRTFDRRCEKAPAGIEPKSRNLLFVTRGDDAMSLSAIGAVAENLHRSFIYMDILDHLTEHKDPFDMMKETLHFAGLASALVYLQNPAPLMARRLFDKPERCRQITEFRRLLESFRGILFLCLEEDDEIDTSFERLGLVHIKPEKNPPS